MAIRSPLDSNHNPIGPIYSQTFAGGTPLQWQIVQTQPSKPTGKTKFKIGDTVEVKAGSLGWGDVRIGWVGKVVNIESIDSGALYFVEFSSPPNPKAVSNWQARVGDLKVTTISLISGRHKIKLNSVIMSDSHRKAIMDALQQIKHHELIFNKWGFSEVMEKGKAISMLFWGPPGTGKTLTAQAIADHFDKQLKIVGTAEIESSNPGQAERNIKAYFEGTKNDTILLFDECDSLVFDRASVGSILGAQVNQLLTSLEHYEGIVIFTTNRLGVLDEAFNRRLSLKLEFPLPDYEQRLQIWRRMFPKKAPLANDIDWEKLAELEITGGYIKNIVLRAARSAASAGLKKIDYESIIEATKAEIKSKQHFEAERKRTIRPPGIRGPGFGMDMIKDSRDMEIGNS